MTVHLVDPSEPGSALLAAHRPGLAATVDSHYADLAAIAGPELVEICRTRIRALVEGAESSTAPEGLPAEVAAACLAFTEQFCHSAQFVTDEQVDELSRHLDPGRAFALAVAVSLSERWYRLAGMLSGLGLE
jgi:hypothetical protein